MVSIKGAQINLLHRRTSVSAPASSKSLAPGHHAQDERVHVGISQQSQSPCIQNSFCNDERPLHVLEAQNSMDSSEQRRLWWLAAEVLLAGTDVPTFWPFHAQHEPKTLKW